MVRGSEGVWVWVRVRVRVRILELNLLNKKKSDIPDKIVLEVKYFES
jgi:hypothetical protein